MKPLRESVFQWQDKKQLKFCLKTSWKEQSFVFTVYLMNNLFQTSALFIYDNEMLELDWLCEHMKKVRSSQAAILALNWVKHSFSLWVSLNEHVRKKLNLKTIRKERLFICKWLILQKQPPEVFGNKRCS